MEPKRKFSLNLVFLLLLNLLVKPFYLFGVEVGVQNEVGAEAYGLYYAMFNFTFLFNVLLDLGINNFQKIRMAQDEASGMQNMATLMPLKVMLSLLYVTVTIVAALLMGFEGHYWFFISWLMLNHILSVFLLMLRANLAGLHLFVRDSILSVTDRLVLIVGVSYALWFGTSAFSIEHFVLLQTASYVIAIAVAWGLTPAVNRWVKLNLSLEAIRRMAMQTWPFALLILLMTAYNKLDGIMLERMAVRGTLEAGIYAQAYRILDAGNSFAFLYAGLLLPMFARLVQKPEEHAALNSLVDQAVRFLIAPAGVVCILTWYYGDMVMDWLYTEHAEESVKSLRWLMGSFVFIAIGYVFGTLVTASGNLRWLNLIATGTVCMNLLLNWWLIPSLGAAGAAMTSFISLGFMAIAQVVYAVWKFRFNFSKSFMRILVLWLITLVASELVSQTSVSTFLSGLIVLSVSAIGFLLIVVKLREPMLKS